MSESRKGEILSILKHKVENHELIFKKDLDKIKDVISVEEIEKYWKWSELKEMLGLVRCKSRKKYISKQKRYNNDELLRLYRALSVKLGKEDCGASIIDMKQNNFPMTGTAIAGRFGGIDNLRRLAGFINNEEIFYREREKIREVLYRKYVEYGRVLSWSELKEDDDIPSVYVVYNRFRVEKVKDLWRKVLGEEN